MGKMKLRDEKDCLNCGTIVEDRFCPHCGQENTLNRPPFYFMFTSFIVEFLNYEGVFFQTLKTLLFKPGKVVTEFLAGKRKTYFPPAKLFVFLTFFVFLVPFILPKFSASETRSPDVENEDESYYVQVGDAKVVLGDINENGVTFSEDFKEIKNVKEFDEIVAQLPKGEEMDWLTTRIGRKYVSLYEKGALNERSISLGEMFIQSFIENLPKMIFIYLPVFAFLLWLFHSKKKWRFYDHGVFTFYFASFISIVVVLSSVFLWLTSIPSLWSENWIEVQLYIQLIFLVLIYVYGVYYFYRSSYKVYEGRRGVSIIRNTLLLGLNVVLISVLLTVYIIVTFLSI